MSINSEVFDYEEMLGMYDEILILLKDRVDLLEVFKSLIRRGDMNYETESTEEEELISSGEEEDYSIIEDDEGFCALE